VHAAVYDINDSPRKTGLRQAGQAGGKTGGGRWDDGAAALSRRTIKKRALERARFKFEALRLISFLLSLQLSS
jgi:hypothetical protein